MNDEIKTDDIKQPIPSAQTGDISESDKLKQQSDEYLNNWKRTQADFINYKKDETKRLGEFASYAASGLILEVIEIVDDLETATKNLSDKSGVEQIIKKFMDLFKKYQVERIPIEGQKFDPALHEALSTEDGGEKIEEIRAGYTMQGRVIRPARVKIITINKQNYE